MLSQRDVNPDGYAVITRSRLGRHRWIRWGIRIWLVLAVVGWLGYLAFLGGVPGNYWLAQAYSFSSFGAVAVMLVALLTAPLFSLAFGLLAIASLKSDWRSRARQGAKKLLLVLLIEAMAITALLPSGMLLGSVEDKLAIAPWQTVYRAIYVAPFDDNYGDLMLVKCRWLGFCRQVYRSYTDVTSAEEAGLQFNASTNEVALYLESRWVYVRSPDSPDCKEVLRSSDPYGKCDFVLD